MLNAHPEKLFPLEITARNCSLNIWILQSLIQTSWSKLGPFKTHDEEKKTYIPRTELDIWSRSAWKTVKYLGCYIRKQNVYSSWKKISRITTKSIWFVFRSRRRWRRKWSRCKRKIRDASSENKNTKLRRLSIYQ